MAQCSRCAYFYRKKQMKNLKLRGIVTLKSSLAHGAFDAASIIIPFRREPVIQRDEAGNVMHDPYVVAVDDASHREDLRGYAQRLLRIIWQSRSDHQWSYVQFSERIAMAARMKTMLAAFAAECINKMGGTHPKFYHDDADFYSGIIGAADSNSILYLLRDSGERMLLVTRLQAESLARHEKRSIAQSALISKHEDAPPTKARFAPFVAQVPIYSGNAMRNGLGRRMAARYILDRYNWRVPLDIFRNLFVGGSLMKTGETSQNIAERRVMRNLMPIYAVFGGAFNSNDMMEGVAKVSKCYPIVRECASILPPAYRDEALLVAMQDIVTTEVGTRREDAVLLSAEYLQASVKDRGDNNSMMYEREVLVAGTKLYSEWRMTATNEIQIGAIVSAFVRFAQSPTLGGLSKDGHGICDVVYQDDAGKHFLSIIDGNYHLSDEAAQCLKVYDAHLDANKDAIAKVLKVVDTNAGTTHIDIEKLQLGFEKMEE